MNMLAVSWGQGVAGRLKDGGGGVAIEVRYSELLGRVILTPKLKIF